MLLSALSVITDAVSTISFWSLLPIIAGLVLGYIAVEQFWFYRAGQGLPGPSWVPPLLGNVFSMVYDPFAFWDNQDKLGPLSWNSIFGTFMLFCQDTDISTTIFKNASNDNFMICLNLNGERLLGGGNIAFLQGDVHKNLRQQVLHLFTKKALSKYLFVQEKCIRDDIAKWFDIAKSKGTVEMRPFVRDLNMFTSQSVFIGPYLTPEVRARVCEDYQLMNEGLLCMPFSFPGSTLWKAIRARKRLVALLCDIVSQSKVRMAAAATAARVSEAESSELDETSTAYQQPECLLDFWMVDTVNALRDYESAKATSDDPASVQPPLHSADTAIAHTLLDFLFAAQDASSSSLTWLCHYLAKYPEFLEKVREEQAQLRPADEPLDLATINQMQYTRQVVKEVLRYRAPATLVPHMAKRDFKLRDDVNIPKGTLVVPSVFSSSFQGFEDPQKFDPDRFSLERKEDIKYKKHFLVFGAGPHRCLGYEYAMMHLLAFTALFATHVNFKRVWTPKSEEIVFGPTIYPGDGCLLDIEPREL
eukprot:TRINITY_DN159_c0_g1_i2.p1 TRINITY_DN159_c0_g1~~TRINITY_DN159_c0_g1_i2.p1  ORF type:complete len:531 (-),score=104.78 TRINITY_DN159_c0_g1_i2:65-1657(-)